MEMTPPGARLIVMGVWEADIAQACRGCNESGQGKEGRLE
jgi:hypothetical protein